mgnify:CR=1 FL=1
MRAPFAYLLLLGGIVLVLVGRRGMAGRSRTEAALEGLEKMRTLLRLGLMQGFLPPLRRERLRLRLAPTRRMGTAARRWPCAMVAAERRSRARRLAKSCAPPAPRARRDDRAASPAPAPCRGW